MAEVGFYLIQNQIRQVDLACRICRKSIQAAQHPMLVKFDDVDAMQQFDALLWQFDATSFVAHDVDNLNSPICLSLTLPEQFDGACLNLGQAIIDPQRFLRVLEIIENTESAKATGRERFKAYRALGIEPVTYQV
jgi:DNA polymerase-3 subunit chi